MSIRTRTTPRRPEQNGNVERSHRIDDEEFWQRESCAGFDDATIALEAWERRYNHERFSMALRGHTPSEILAAKLGPQATSVNRGLILTRYNSAAQPAFDPGQVRSASGESRAIFVRADERGPCRTTNLR